eukprot:CAMPEP_0185038740 /NCGR_PEP_ID=MMETSP1103-20130426/34763_1 /TAXON_ID=36769 /ORGANISM="Paraphysomonas bandaiensis, Strain Caron Lab Isolate" /LENGTH=751 /DNA_ID=CAMNT_0027577297 /DNA_START=81 /DNA_END=2333 /DNA_ORIENTATION=+
MTSPLALRLTEAGGVACIFSFLQKNNISKLCSFENDRLNELEAFKRNLAFEGNEILEHLSHNLYLELRSIRNKHIGESSLHNADAIYSWVATTAGGSIPYLCDNPPKQDERINSKIRYLSPTQRSVVRLSNHTLIPQAPVVAITNAIREFEAIENEIVSTFTAKQIQTSRLISSIKSRLYAESTISKVEVLFTPLMQIAGCSFFLHCMRQSVAHMISSDSMQHAPLPARWKAALYMIPLSYAALVLSPLDNAVSDDINSTPSQGNSPSRVSPPPLYSPLPFRRLPPDPFSGVVLPIHRPLTTPEDPLTIPAVFTHCILRPFTEGGIFRHLLLQSLLSAPALLSPLKAHTLTCIAATLSQLASDISSNSFSYYALLPRRDEDGGYENYDRNAPPIASSTFISLPYRPLLLQAVCFLTGRFYLSVLMDASLSLAHMMRDTALRTETIEIGNLQLYRPSCEVAALVDHLITSLGITVSRLIDVVGGRSADDLAYDQLVESLIMTQHRTAHGGVDPKEGIYLSTDEMQQLLDAVALHSSKIHQPHKDVMPPKCAEGTGNTNSESLYRLDLFFDDDITTALKVNEDIDRIALDRYRGGRIDLKTAKWCLQAILHDPHGHILQNSSLQRELRHRVFYWDKHASEEDILDLLQEYNAHMLEKIYRSTDDFVFTSGLLRMMELQGKGDVSHEDLEDYYDKLEEHVKMSRDREEVFFLSLFGLTHHKLDTILYKWELQSSEIKDLMSSWDDFFRSSDFKG